MNLPQSKQPLLAYADDIGVSQSLILQFIEGGGTDYLLNAWLAYAAEELKNKELLDGMTPVGGLELGRRLFEDVASDFQKQFKAKAEEQ